MYINNDIQHCWKGDYMKKKYTTPRIASYGNCAVLIQGDCGWGGELPTFDKKNYYRKEWKQWIALPCPGPDPNGQTNCYMVCQKNYVCASKHENCTIGSKKKA